MIGLVIKAAVMLSMLFGSAGGVVALSADSLPDSPLYTAKLAVEQARLALTFDDAGKAAMHLEFARERVREMTQEEAVPDDAAVARLRNELRKGLELAIELPEDELMSWMTLALEVTSDGEGNLLRPRDRLSDARGEAARMMRHLRKGVEDGSSEPLQKKLRYKRAALEDVLLQLTFNEEPDPSGAKNHYGPGGPCEGADCEPGQHGPGEPCDGEDCEPDGDQNQYGPGEP